MQIISGVSQLRNGKSRGVLLLDSKRETLKDISRMLGNDLPLNSASSPPFQSQNSLSVNALVDALVNPTSLSPSQLQRIEERVAALEAAVSLLSSPHADHHPVDRPAVSHQPRYLPLPPALLAEPLVLRVSDEPLLRHLPDDPAVAGLSSLPLPRRRCTTTRRFSISSRPTRRT